MDSSASAHLPPDFPNARAVRRFWIAWMVFLLALLGLVIVVILIAAVVAEPMPISPAG